MINIKSPKINMLFLLSSILLIVIVLGFTGGINIASFQKNYTNSLISSYVVSGKETVRKIEYAVKYGQTLEVFYGIEDLLAEKVNESFYLEEVQVVLPDGAIIYNQNGTVNDKKIPQGMQQQLSSTNGTADYTSLLDDGKYHAFIPITDPQKNWLGSVDFVFSEEIIKEQTNKYLLQLTYYLIILAMVALIFLIIFISKFPIVNKNREINKKLLLTGFIIILGTVQGIYGYINYTMFKDAYIEKSKENVAITSQIIEKDINYVVNMGVPYNEIYNLDDYLKNVISESPEVEAILVSDKDGEVFYSSEDNKVSQLTSSELSYSAPLVQDTAGLELKLTVNLSKEHIDNKLKDIIYDTLTVLVMSLIVLAETTYFSLIFLRRQLKRESSELTDQLITSEAEMVRPLAFILFFGVFMSGSFIPLLMQELYQPILGLSKNVILGLPISMEMLTGAIATVLGGYMIDKRSWKTVFFIGLTISAVGTAFSGLASSAVTFILARGIAGAGYGFALISIRAYVNNMPTKDQQTTGFTALFSGLYAGVIAGVVVGAMLADRMGFSNVFFVILVFIVLAAIFTILFIKDTAPKTSKQQDLLAPTKINVVGFLSNGKVLVFFLCIVIPLTVSSMFLDYYFPVFASNMGASVSNVGRAFMLNGLCIVYLGPLLSKYASNHLKPETAVIISGIIIVAGFILFSLHGSVLTAFLVVILLGISESFGLMAQNSYLLNLKATGAFGVGKAIGYYDNVRKIGQMLGPVLFGSVMALGIKAVGIIGIVILATLVVFWLVNRTKNETDHQQQRGVKA